MTIARWRLRPYDDARVQALSREARLPALLAQLFDFALDHVALQHAEMLQKENSIEMVYFMTERAREHVFAANLKRLAFGVLRLNRNELRSHHVSAEAGNRKAALFLTNFTFSVRDLGID